MINVEHVGLSKSNRKPLVSPIFLCPSFLSILYPINLQDFSYQHKHVLTSRMKNSMDPDQLASEKPADLNPHCFQNRIYMGLAW